VEKMNFKHLLSFTVAFVLSINPLVAFARGTTSSNSMPEKAPVVPSSGAQTTNTTVPQKNLTGAQTSETSLPATPAAPAATTQTTTAIQAPPTTVPNDATIQDIAVASKKTNKTGIYLAMAGAAAAGGYAVWRCSVQDWGGCAMGVAGMVALIMISKNMQKAQDQSDGTYQAVTTNDSNTDTAQKLAASSTTSTTVPGAEAPTPPAWNLNPNWKIITSSMDKLQDQGVKIDLKKGIIKTPNGKQFSASNMDSTAGMKAMGASDTDIKNFKDMMAQAAKVAEKNVKAADGTDMFGDGSIGGGGKSSSNSAGVNPYAGAAQAGAGPQLGINRDPAQVAGMKKSFNGEPIGVSGDSLFNMIDRRYELHDKNGSFLPP
jgi:hypothetical protein